MILSDGTIKELIKKEELVITPLKDSKYNLHPLIVPEPILH